MFIVLLEKKRKKEKRVKRSLVIWTAPLMYVCVCVCVFSNRGKTLCRLKSTLYILYSIRIYVFFKKIYFFIRTFKFQCTISPKVLLDSSGLKKWKYSYIYALRVVFITYIRLKILNFGQSKPFALTMQCSYKKAV